MHQSDVDEGEEDRERQEPLRPPGAPGTAPRISRRLRAASMSTTCRFSIVRRTLPMWPDMRLPGNTRPGVWRWPIEPGARWNTEAPCDAGPPAKLWRFMVPA